MLRINTMVSDVSVSTAQGRSPAELRQSLARLSTGMRVNTPKDDAVGYAVGEMFRSDRLTVSDAGRNAAANAAQTAGASGSIQNVESAMQSAEAIRSRILSVVDASAFDSQTVETVHRLLSG